MAGRIFAEAADHRKDLMIEVVENVDRGLSWSWLCAIGPELAGDLLDDGLAARTPKWQRRLIDIALRALAGPYPLDIRAVAIGLSAASVGNDQMHIRNALKAALVGTPIARAIAHSVLGGGNFGAPIPEASQAHRAVADLRKVSPLLADLIEPQLGELGLSEDARKTLDDILAELRETRLVDLGETWELSPLAGQLTSHTRAPITSAGLKDREIATALEILFGSLGPDRWSAAASLQEAVWPLLSREPVDPLLES